MEDVPEDKIDFDSIFFGVGLTFVILKLCGEINWSWWFITMPFYAGEVLGGIIVLIMEIIKIFKRWPTCQGKK